MIKSYIKTSGRSLLRHKLFSAINIAGLAFSMSVGLLLIAFLFDLHAYDRFNKNGDRIYRITNVLTSSPEQGAKYATTSVKAGKLIRENVSGLEEVAIVRRDFSGVARVGDRQLSVRGLWAEPSLLRIFTFPMLAGNPETALTDPYSIVLTETTARKLFGEEPAVGREVAFDTLPYKVTGVLRDVPFFSHLSFEALVSFATAEQGGRADPRFGQWTDMSSNYVYLLKQEHADTATLQAQLNALARQENRAGDATQIGLELLPLYDIVVGEELRSMGRMGPHIPPALLWVLGGLALVVILSACFNYTNLTIARAMRRFREVGLRQVIGAGKRQIRQQFLTEAILISLAALILSSLLFFLLRPHLLALAPELQQTVKLELTPTTVAAFLALSVAVGAIAGFLPALFFSKVGALSALRDTSPVRIFKHVPLRRALVVLQYTLTLIFITSTAVAYVQYKNILSFDLGYKTDQILNIDMQGADPERLLNELGRLPEVTALSKSFMITSVGNAWGGFMKSGEARDSALVLTNLVDENYLPLHQYELLAGSNFSTRPSSAEGVRELIVNQQVLKRFNISPDDPGKAIGQEVTFSGYNFPARRMTIVGVMKDFHYGKVQDLIAPAAFMPWTPENRAFVNVKIHRGDLAAARDRIGSVWKQLDPVHPFHARFYLEEIENAYSEYSAMIKIIGFLSLLAISIASLGLFGMVAFTTETRMKEIGIRKVLGASSGNLIYLLSRGFLGLLALAALIALPLTYLFFEKMVLTRFPYHTPIHLAELCTGLFAVLLIAFVMIGSLTLKAAHSNPARVLKSE